MRALGASFDIPAMRDRLLELAARCDTLARSLEQDPQAAGLKPAVSPDSRRSVFGFAPSTGAEIHASSTMIVGGGKTPHEPRN